MSFNNYLGLGATFMAGFEPIRVNTSGEVISEGFGAHVRTVNGQRLPFLQGPMPGWDTMTGGQKAMSAGVGVFGLGFSAYQMYQGYQENGMSGAAQYGMIDLAASAGVARFAYGSPGTRGYQPGSTYGNRFKRLGLKAAGTNLSSGGYMNVGMRYIGASVGASVGWSLGHLPGDAIAATGLPGSETVGNMVGVAGGSAGALAGGYFGAAPIRNALRHPVIGAAAVSAVGLATVGYGAYHVSKAALGAGYAHSQMKRGVQTSGDMAAFMTQGATTMRSRAVTALNRNHMNARSALGQEANFMHYSGRDYSSRYR